MTIHSSSARDNIKQEPPLSEPSSKQAHTESNYLTGQSPVIELPLYLPPRLVTVAFTSTSEILKEYFGGERPSTLPQDTSDPRVFSRTNSSDVSSTQPLNASDSVDVSSSQSQSVMTLVIHSQSRDQIRKELNQNDDFLISLKEAEKGKPEAQFNLGVMYERGKGVEANNAYAQAVNWYRKAARQGHAGAQFHLGLMYVHGKGVDQNQTKAVYWFRKAAAQGHAGAQCNLGLMYQLGEGVKKDDAQALDWYRKAAAQGHANAQCNLGLMYAYGIGVDQDHTQAVNWYRKAADQGDAGAQFNLGSMYEFGLAVEKDYAQSLDWYSKAAAQGYAEAQLIMASAFHKGLGVKKDILQATYWMLRSAHDGKRSRPFPAIREFIQNFYSDVIQCIPAALMTFPEFKYIKTISFKKIELYEQDFLSIGQMIRANPNLKGLNLKDQFITDADALILSQSLAFNTTLTEIIFDDRYNFNATIFDQIKASLAQNVIIAKLRERLKGRLITGPNGLPIRVPYITRSDELPLEVLEIIVDNMIVEASKVGKDKKAIIAGIDEFLLSVSRETLKYDFSVMSKHHEAT